MDRLAFAVKSQSCSKDLDMDRFLDEVLGKYASKMNFIAPDKDEDGNLKCESGIFHVAVGFESSLDEEVFTSLRDKAANSGVVLDGETYAFDVFAFDKNFPNFLDGKEAALVMDMDMTTVQMEGIDEIARRVGVFDEVAAITHSAMAGHLDFKESLTKRVALLKGGDAAKIIAEISANIPLTEGLKDLIAFFDKVRAQSSSKVCIASGGFHELIEAVNEVCHFDDVAANRLEVDDNGKFTGKVVGAIVDAQGKADFVKSLKESGIAKERIVVIGDGANDLLMIAEGGLPFAYHAKPKVQAQVKNVINVGNLSTVAFILKNMHNAHKS